MVFKPLKLDVDLYADRTRKAEVSGIDMKLPEDDIFMASSVVFEILNYNPDNIYDVWFSHGKWRHDGPLIHYDTPEDHAGEVILRIKHSSGDGEGYVLLPDGTSYNDAGVISKRSLDSYPTESEKIVPDAPPVPTNRDGGLPPPMTLQSYDVSSLFGDLGGKGLKRERAKEGNVSDYHLPSEESKEDDALPGLYRVSGNNFLAIPRNSNVTESGGNIFDGYGSPGDVGGSLIVKKGVIAGEMVEQWVFTVLNNDLSAVMPEDIVSLCLTTATFTPKLVGNPRGHTFWWELIEGDDTSITWLTPRDQVEIVVSLGSVKVDRVFRFWISKGTRHEKYYDVTIYGTPRDVIPAMPTEQSFNAFGNQLNLKVHSAKPVLLWYKNVWNKELRLRVRS